MKLLAYYDEDNNGKAHYVNVSQTVYDAVFNDIREKTRKRLVDSKDPLFYRFSKKYRMLLEAYKYLLNFG